MRYYPVCLHIEGRRCLVIGGGRVAERKVSGLLESGAEVEIISPEITEGLRQLLAEGKIRWQARGYQPGDVSGFFLVMAATDDRQVQEQVQADAERQSILVNVADVPERCNFILPALVKRGALSIAVSTSGKSPALAKRLRRELQEQFGQEYELLTEVMGVLRPFIMQWGLPQSQNETIFQALVDGAILEPVRRRDWPALQHYLEQGLNRQLPEEVCRQLKKLIGS